MEIYVPRVEFDDDDVLQYRAVHRYKDVWLHIVYAPQSRTMRLIAEPIVRSGVPEYTAEPIAEYHHREENVHWWRFRVDGQILQINLIQGEPLGEGIHAQGVAVAVSLLQAVSLMQQLEQVSEEVLS